tara:strand:- start:537 stop:1508 length:972 start_codon:yes stop_codon:yes gene_type:complete
MATREEDYLTNTQRYERRLKLDAELAERTAKTRAKRIAKHGEEKYKAMLKNVELDARIYAKDKGLSKEKTKENIERTLRYYEQGPEEKEYQAALGKTALDGRPDTIPEIGQLSPLNPTGMERPLPSEGIASLLMMARKTLNNRKRRLNQEEELTRQQSMLGSMPSEPGIIEGVKAKFRPEPELGPFDLVNAYHRDTIEEKAAATDREGRPVTVNATGIDVNGRIYMVPGYDRETGKIYTDSEEDQKALKETYTPLINKGVIPSVAPTAWEGQDMLQHPANVAARENHSLMDAQADEAMAAVNPDFDNMEESYELPNLGAMPAR